MKMAYEFSKLSQAVRSKVGCLIVSPSGQILSQGYNGMPHGMDNRCETMECTCTWNHGCQYTTEPVASAQIDYCLTAARGQQCDKLKLITKNEVLHAETNAILKCAKEGGRTMGAKMYVTLSPCYECAKIILQSGIDEVYYMEEYRDTSGLKLLQENGIKTIFLPIENKEEPTKEIEDIETEQSLYYVVDKNNIPTIISDIFPPIYDKKKGWQTTEHGQKYPLRNNYIMNITMFGDQEQYHAPVVISSEV